MEKGVDADVGRTRVTIRVAKSIWEGIFDDAGQLLSEKML